MMHRKICSLLLALLLVGGCTDDDPVSASVETRAFSLLGGFDVGQFLLLEGEDVAQLFLAGGADGAQYLIVPFFASDDGRATLQVEVEGRGITTGPLRSASEAAAPEAALPQLRGASAPSRPGARATTDDPFHLALREWEHERAPRLMRSPEFQRQRDQMLRRAASGARTMDVPQVGEILDLRVIDPLGSNFCEDFVIRPGRVAAVTEQAVLVVDTLNPAGGAADEQLLEAALEFDNLVYPVNVENFGEPSDIDDNRRVIIFITSVVNELTPPNARSFTAGFFFGGDLFPNGEPGSVFEGEDPDFVCPSSNEAEIFYIIAPDPQGEINNNVRPTEEVVDATTGIVAHEFQHLINLSRRLYVNQAQVAEEVWLNEGLSHIAEELTFYAATPLEPRQNLGPEELLQSEETIEALLRFGFDNLARLFTYLDNPDEESLLGIDNLPTRGASWAFLRYAADQEEGPDAPFFFDLVNSQTNGVRNLNQVLVGFEAIDLMQTWTTSVFTDDLGALQFTGPLEPALLQQPSWNFRRIFTELTTLERYPLEIEFLTGQTGPTLLTLQGGGAAFIRTGVDAGAQARIQVTSGGVTPEDRLRITVVRLR